MAHGQAYFEAFPDLAGTYLEDSWVLALAVEGRQARFDLDLVLTPSHPAYRPPLPGEQHCYVRADLAVSGESLAFRPSGAPPAVDASATEDFGNIDLFVNMSEDCWRIEGTWGTLDVQVTQGQCGPAHVPQQCRSSAACSLCDPVSSATASGAVTMRRMLAPSLSGWRRRQTGGAAPLAPRSVVGGVVPRVDEGGPTPFCPIRDVMAGQTLRWLIVRSPLRP